MTLGAATLPENVADLPNLCGNESLLTNELESTDFAQLHESGIDFGLARLAESESVTRTGDRAGTLRYMSPEYASGKYWDDQTDVYSLGVTLYELLALVPPFPQGERQGLLRAIIDEEPRPLRQVDATIPEKRRRRESSCGTAPTVGFC